MNTNTLTAEAVSSGHPDKFADIISDTILDECLRQDPNSRVACEVLATSDLLIVAGEITTSATMDIPLLVKAAAELIGIDISGTKIKVAIRQQSSDISNAVDGISELGAGDQGIVVGYATNETKELMPLEHSLATRLIKQLERCRHDGSIQRIGADAKSQVSIQGGGIKKIVVSVQHGQHKCLDELRQELQQKVIAPVFADYDLIDAEILINPSGRFVKGGLDADTGLTGRKIVADAYGPRIPVGGGAFSGKDPTKVDRSGAYYARFIAKNIVAARLSEKCQVTLAYAIGKAKPVAITINTFGTSVVADCKILAAVKKLFNPRPAAIIEELSLKTPIYANTVLRGHFGCNSFSWEQTHKANELRREVYHDG